jgi:hypothetical protein
VEQKPDSNGNTTQQTVVIHNSQPKSNGIGVAGFVLSLVGLFLGWIPLAGQIIWLLGLIFSFIGVFRMPNGLAAAGLVLSLVGAVIFFSLLGSLVAMLKS